jgi:hypothetical protein
MHRSRYRVPADSPSRPGAPVRGPARLNRAGVALALQRVAGNSATARLLARDEAAVGFRLLLVDDGVTGLDAEIVKTAIAIVAKEIARITKDSGEEAVKAGFEIEHRTSKPEQKEVRDLGQRTWLIFLTRGRDAEHAIELATEYVPMSQDDRKKQEARFKRQIAAEGGVNIESVEPRRRRSESVGFVGTEIALQKLKEPNAGGARTAAAIVADVILHELGHALGHNDILGTMDHDDAGVMTARLVLGSGPFETRRYSTKSAKVIRERLEELAKKPARKRG